MDKETVKRLEELIPETAKHIVLTNNALWNEKMGVLLKSLTGALRDIQEYNSKKFGRKSAD